MIPRAVSDWIKKNIDTLEYLYDRWQDEKKYEDFNEYIKTMQSKLHNDFKFIKMTKQPFQINFKFNGKEYGIKVTANKVSTLIYN